MTQTLPADEGTDDDLPEVGVARRAIPVVTDGGAADAWRRAARGVAWVGAVAGGILPLMIVLNAVSSGPTNPFRDLKAIFQPSAWPNVMLSLVGLTRIALGILLLVGSIAVLTRRRWGATVLMAYAVGVVPGTAINVVWFAVSQRNRTFNDLGGYPVWVLTFALSNLAGLAFPAVVFFVMRAARPHLGSASGGSAFEPLAAMPVGPSSPPSRQP